MAKVITAMGWIVTYAKDTELANPSDAQASASSVPDIVAEVVLAVFQLAAVEPNEDPVHQARQTHQACRKVAEESIELRYILTGINNFRP